MKKILFLLFLGILVKSQVLCAQLDFKETIYDFGTLYEGSKTSYDFTFTNKGQNSIVLKPIQTNCQCLRPTWTATPILPGESGEVLVTLDTQGRTGNIVKSVLVNYDGLKEPIILTVKGNVNTNPQQASAPATAFKDTVGSLAIDRLEISTGLLKSDQNTEFTIPIKNIGKKALKFSRNIDAELPFEVILPAKPLKKEEESIITLKFTGEKSKQTTWQNNAPFSHQVSFFMESNATETITITLNGTWQRVYSQEELDASPRIEFESLEFDGGEIIEGQVLKHQFNFTNTGKSDLIIESAKASCGCTATAPKEKVIKPGQSSFIEANFDSHYKKGAQHKTITVRTNDLVKPTVILHMKSNVKPDPFKNNSGAPVNNSEDPFK